MNKLLKKFSQITILLSLLIISIISVSAIGFTMPSTLTLGSDTQSRDTYTTTLFTITNTDNASQITNLNAAFTPNIPGYTAQNFNITMIGATQINAANSTTVTIQGYVPLNFDSGNRQIGIMTITGTSAGSTPSNTIPVYMNTESELKVSEVTVDINGDDEKVSEGEKIEVKRGDSITLTVEIENTFSSSKDITINDVTIDVDSNKDIDLNEDEDAGDLDADDTTEVTFTFDIPEDADDGTETVTITVDGEDDNDAIHTSEFRFEFDIEVKTYDLRIVSITTPTGDACIGQISTINVEVENTGKRDLAKATVYITSDDLQLTKKIDQLVIDEGDRKTISMQVLINENMLPGTYLIDVDAYYQEASSSKTDTESGTINLKKCTTTPSTTTQVDNTPKTNTTFEVVNQGTQTQTNNGQIYAVPISRKGLSTDMTYILLLTLGCIIVVLLIIILLRTGRAYYK